MENAQNPASRKESPGDFDSGVVIPIQLATLNIISALFKEEGAKSTKIEEALKKDPLLLGFMENHFDEGTELLKDHYAIFRESLDKFTKNKRVKIGVGEDALFLPNGSGGNNGKTKVDETTSVGLLQELDEAEATESDNEMDDDEAHDEMDDDEAHVDEDMGNEDVKQVTVRKNLCEMECIYQGYNPNACSPIAEIINHQNIGPLADRIANDDYLVDISNKLLGTLRNVEVVATNENVQQHFELVFQFWKSEEFRNAFYEEFVESYYLWMDITLYASRVDIEKESHEEKVDRIKKDPSIEKLLDEKDPVVRMRGTLGILLGYWIKNDMLLVLVKEIYARDSIPKLMRMHIKGYLPTR